MGRGGPQPAYQVRPGDLQLDGAAADLEDPDATPIVSQPVNSDASVSSETVDEIDDGNNNWNVLPKDVVDEEKSVDEEVDGSGLSSSCRDVAEEERGVDESIDDMGLVSSCNQTDTNNSCLEQETSASSRSQSLLCAGNQSLVELRYLCWLLKTNVEMSPQCYQVEDTSSPSFTYTDDSLINKTNNNSDLEHSEDDSKESNEYKNKIVDKRDGKEEEEKVLEIEIQCQYPNSVGYYSKMEDVKESIDLEIPMKTILKENKDTEIQTRRRVERKVTINLMPIQDLSSETLDLSPVQSENLELTKEKQTDSDTLIENMEEDFKNTESYTQPDYQKTESPTRNLKLTTAEEMKKTKAEDKCRVSKASDVSRDRKGRNIAGEWEAKMQMAEQEKLAAKIDVMDFVHPGEVDDDTRGEHDSLTTSSNLEDVDHTTVADFGSQLNSYVGSWNQEKDGNHSVKENATLTEQEMGDPICSEGDGSVNQLNSLVSLSHDEEKQNVIAASDDTANIGTKAKNRKDSKENLNAKMSLMNSKEKLAAADGDSSVACSWDAKGDLNTPGVFPTATVFTASSEYDVGTFFLQHQNLDMFDLHKVQAGSASHAALHVMGALDTKSEYECGQLLDKTFKGELEKNLLPDRFSRVVTKPPCGTQRRRSRSRSRASRDSKQSEAEIVSRSHNQNVDKESLQSRSQMEGLKKNISCASSTGDATFMSCSMQVSSSHFMVPTNLKTVSVSSESQKGNVSSEQDQKLPTIRGFPSKALPIAGTITEESSLEDSPLSQNLPANAGKAAQFSQGHFIDGKKERKESKSVAPQNEMIQKGSCLQNNRRSYVGLLSEMRTSRFSKVPGFKRLEGTGVQLSSETTDLAQISSLDRASEDGTDGYTKDGTLKNVSSLLVSGISKEGKSASTLNTSMDSFSLKQKSETPLSQSDQVNAVAKRSDRFKQVHSRKRLAKQPFENNLLEQSGSCDLTSCEQSDKGNISEKISNESVDVAPSHPTSNVQIADRQATIGSWILRGDQEWSETDASVASSLVGSKAGKSRYKQPRCSHSEYTLSPSLHYSSDVTDVKTSRSIASNLVQIGVGETSSSVHCTGVQCSPIGISQRGLKHFVSSYESVQEDSDRVLTEFQGDVILSDNTITLSIHHSCAGAGTNLPNLRDLTISNPDTQSKSALTRQKSIDDKMSVGIQTTLVSYEDSSDFSTSKNYLSSGNRNKFSDIEKRPSNPTPAFTCNQTIMAANKQCSSIAIQCSFDQQLKSQTFSENQMSFDLEKSSASTTISSVYLDRQSVFGNSLSSSIHHSSKAFLEQSKNPSAGPFVSAGNQCDLPGLELRNVGLETRDKVSPNQEEKTDVGLDVCIQTTRFPSESRHGLSNVDSISTPSYHYSSINSDVATARKTGDGVWKGLCATKGNQCHPLKIQYENTMGNSAADTEAKNQMFYSGSSYYSDSATRWLSCKRSRSFESVISRSVQCQSLGLSSAPSKRSSVRTRSDHELFRQSHTSELYVQSASVQVGTKLPLDMSTLEYITMVSESVQNERLSSKSPTLTHRTRGVEDTCALSTLQEGTLSESLADIDSVARMTNRDVPSLPGAYSDDVNSHPILPYLRHGAGSGLLRSHVNDDVCNFIGDTRMAIGDNEHRQLASTRLLPPIQASTHVLMTDSIPCPGTFLDQDYLSDQHSRSSFKNETQTESKARSRQRKLSSTVSFMEPPVVDESQTLTSQDSADDVRNVGARPKSFQAVVQQQYSSQQLDSHESQLFMRHSQPLPGIQPASVPRVGYADAVLTSFRSTQADQMVNKQDRRQPTPTQHESTEGESEIKSTLDTAVPPPSQYRKDFLSRPSVNLRTLPNRLEDIGVLACLDNSWLLAEASARPVRPDENYFFDSDLSHSVDAMTPQSKNRFIHRNSQEDEGVFSKKWLSIDGSGDVYATTGSEISDKPSDLKTESQTRTEIQEVVETEKFDSVKSKESAVQEAEPASTEKEETDIKETKSVEREKNLSQATLDLPSVEDVSQAAVRPDGDGVESSQAETETKAGGDKPRKQRERDIETRRKGPGKRGPSGGNDGEPPKKLQRKKLDRPSLFPGRVLAESHYYPTSNVISVLVKPVNIDVNKDNLNMQVQIHRRQPPPTTLPTLKVNSKQRAKQLARRMVFGRRQLGLKCPPMLTRNIIDLRAANPPFNTSVDPEATRRYEWMYRNHSYL